MVIEEERRNPTTVILSPEGRLDAVNAPELERKVWRLGGNVNNIILDFSKVPYISSAGLRVLLQIQKIMNKNQGGMRIKNLNPSILSVFEMTGLMALFVQEEKMVLVEKEKTKTRLILSVSGIVDNETAPALEKNLYREANDFSSVCLDCTQLNSISGEGLEILLRIQKDMAKKNGKLVLQHISEPVQAMIEDAGYTGAFNQEENMFVQKNADGTGTLLSFIGRLDSKTVPDLQEEIKFASKGEKITLDFTKLTYISKEGFGAFLQTQTALQQRGVPLEIKL
jgi:anti-sigma B factor antagonist